MCPLKWFFVEIKILTPSTSKILILDFVVNVRSTNAFGYIFTILNKSKLRKRCILLLFAEHSFIDEQHLLLLLCLLFILGYIWMNTSRDCLRDNVEF